MLKVFLATILILWSSPAIGNVCFVEAIKAELVYNIPNGLLAAIARVESDAKPWAINLNGKGFYPDTRIEAEELLKNKDGSERKGHTAVGCMQIAVRWHKHNFDSVYEMIDPEKNVDYAARYLLSHYKKYMNWNAAIKRYHGGNSKQNRIYLKKIKKYYND